MASESCDVCERSVRIAGGIGDLWNFAFESTQGMTLELVDGAEFFLCFECMEALPDDVRLGRLVVVRERTDPVEEDGNDFWHWR